MENEIKILSSNIFPSQIAPAFEEPIICTLCNSYKSSFFARKNMI